MTMRGLRAVQSHQLKHFERVSVSELGVGIIGCGNISTVYLELAQLFSGIEVRALADINHGSRSKSEEFNVRVESIEGVLGAGDIDVVVNLKFLMHTLR